MSRRVRADLRSAGRRDLREGVRLQVPSDGRSVCGEGDNEACESCVRRWRCGGAQQRSRQQGGRAAQTLHGTRQSHTAHRLLRWTESVLRLPAILLFCYFLLRYISFLIHIFEFWNYIAPFKSFNFSTSRHQIPRIINMQNTWNMLISKRTIDSSVERIMSIE